MEKVKCDNCGEYFLEEDLTETGDGYLVCEDCLDNDYFYCDGCAEYYHNDVAIDTQDGAVCENCVEYYYIRCEHCGEYVYNNNTYTTDDDYTLCSYCYENETNYCEGCECTYYDREGEYCEEREEWLCNDCYEEHCNALIKDYYYKPDPVFKGKGKWYYGIELEIGKIKENKYELAEELLNEFEGLVYLKEDGSLDNGFEIVTHPLTLEYLYNSKLFEKIEEIFRGRARAFNRGGMHIHISRSAFKNDKEFKKFFYFINKHKKFTSFIAQRESDRWAKYKVCRTKWKNLRERKDQDYNLGENRYCAINLENIHTVEVRVFNANIIAQRNYKNVEFTDALIKYIKKGYGVENPKNFVKWVMKFKTKYSHLREFFSQRANSLQETLQETTETF